jgi:hypothetical protein
MINEKLTFACFAVWNGNTGAITPAGASHASQLNKLGLIVKTGVIQTFVATRFCALLRVRLALSRFSAT